MFSQEPNGAPITPAYKAIKRFANVMGTSPERLAAEHINLTPEQRFAKLKEKLRPIQLLTPTNTPGIVQKMEGCLKDLNAQINSQQLQQGLELVNTKRTQNEKLAALKELFKNEQILRDIAQYWNRYIRSITPENISKTDEVNRVFRSYSNAFTESASQILSQKDFDPVSKFWKDLMSICDAAIDLCLITAGHKAVFARELEGSNKAPPLDPGEFLDAKQNLVRGGPDGVRPVGRRR